MPEIAIRPEHRQRVARAARAGERARRAPRRSTGSRPGRAAAPTPASARCRRRRRQPSTMQQCPGPAGWPGTASTAAGDGDQLADEVAGMPFGVALARSSVPSSRSAVRYWTQQTMPEGDEHPRARRAGRGRRAQAGPRSPGRRRKKRATSVSDRPEQVADQLGAGEGLAQLDQATPRARRSVGSCGHSGRRRLGPPRPAPGRCPPARRGGPRGRVTASPYCANSSRTNPVESAVDSRNRCAVAASSAPRRRPRSAWPARPGVPSATIRPPSRIEDPVRQLLGLVEVVRGEQDRRPVLAARPRTRSWNSRRASGSKPAVGSSRNSSSGRPTMPIATSSRRRWPPDSVGSSGRPASVSPTAAISSSGVPRPRAVAVSSTARSSEPRCASSSRTRHLPWSRHDCSTMPTRARHRSSPCAGSMPSTATRPGRPLPEALEDLDRRGLAGPVRAEQRQHLAAVHAEGHVVQHLGRRRTACGGPRRPAPSSCSVRQSRLTVSVWIDSRAVCQSRLTPWPTTSPPSSAPATPPSGCGPSARCGGSRSRSRPSMSPLPGSRAGPGSRSATPSGWPGSRCTPSTGK